MEPDHPDNLNPASRAPHQIPEANEQRQPDHPAEPRQRGARTARTQKLATLSFLGAIVVALLLFFFQAQPNPSTQNTPTPNFFKQEQEIPPQEPPPLVNSFAPKENTSKMSSEQT